MHDRGILFDRRCPVCAGPWSPRQVHGVIACTVCHTPVVVPGDDCDRWQGDKEEAKADVLPLIPRQPKPQRSLYLGLRRGEALAA